jgi:hypothetical protein
MMGVPVQTGYVEWGGPTRFRWRGNRLCGQFLRDADTCRWVSGWRRAPQRGVVAEISMWSVGVECE